MLSAGVRLASEAAVWAAVAALSVSSAQAGEDDWRWRIFDQGSDALLAIANSDSPGDVFGLPILSCQQNSNTITVEGEAKDNLRVAMANLIRADQPPSLQVQPATQSDTNTIELFFSAIDGWRYKFDLRADHAAFAGFSREGSFNFKVGPAAVHEEFKVGLESVAKFLDLCRTHGN